MDLDDLLGSVRERFKPYGGRFPEFTALPAKGLPHEQALQLVTQMQRLEEGSWRRGFVSGAVYHGEREHIRFATRAYAAASQSNPLHPDIWPSITRMEGEIVSMTAHMLGGGPSTRGAVTSGGTESILLAMKSYRDHARATRNVVDPEVVLPTTAHVAFLKACQYFGIRPEIVPVGPDLAADLEAVKAAVSSNTVAVVGSAPCFPYGVIDPIREMAEVAKDHHVGFHCDACLGGFVLPWARRLGRAIPEFDLRLPGVTSLSVDTHKYGYAPKGTSVILYSDPELLHRQYFVATRWPGGIYFSSTLAGSRPGGLVAAAWATLISLGEEGYLAMARSLLETTDRLRAGVRGIPHVRLLGDSPIVVAFTTEPEDPFQVMDRMSHRGWFLNGLQSPPGLHLAVTLRHTPPTVAERFLRDLAWAVRQAKKAPTERGLAPVYGLAGTMPEESAQAFLESIMDWMYHPS